MNIIFDLDGTLVDSSDRMYKLFDDLEPEFGYKKEEYWKLKKNEISHKMIFESAGRGREYYSFHCRWLDQIEASEYLSFDTLYPNIIESLETLSVNNKLILLTARQYEHRLKQELDQMGLIKYFAGILVASRNNKEELLNAFLSNAGEKKDTIYISDMGKDILIGKKVGIKTIAVTYGFMNEERLIAYKPDYLADSIESVIDIIMKGLPQDTVCKLNTPI